jgi:error-prone DNA polymerase
MPKAEAEAIMAERTHAPFKDLDDFVLRSRLKASLLLRLALRDTFASFGLTPRAAYWHLLRLLAFRQARESKGQLSLFQPGMDQLLPVEADLPLQSLTPWERVQRHYEAFNASAEAHPMQALRQLLPKLPPRRCAEAKQAPSNSIWTQAGFLIVRQRPGTSAGVIFATLEDETGLLDLVLHPKVYERYRDEFLNHHFFIATGLLQRDQDSVSVLLRKIKAVDPEEALKAMAHNWH